jgi:hypothetical protein
VLFYTAYPTNQIGEIKPGSSAPDKVVSLPGVTSSVGSLQFAPDGSFKIASYSGGGFYNATLSADGLGTYDITSTTLGTSPGRGPEGMVYVPTGSPLFTSPSMLLSEYGTGTVGAYQTDANNDPIVASRHDFITGLNGAEGAFVDPVTGDFMFSSFGSGNEVFIVSGFVPPPSSAPEPGTIAGLAIGFIASMGFALRRKLASR